MNGENGRWLEEGKGWKEETKQPRTTPHPYSPRSEHPIRIKPRTRKAGVEGSGPARVWYGPRHCWTSSAV
jgi:hypothetical protein